MKGLRPCISWASNRSCSGMASLGDRLTYTIRKIAILGLGIGVTLTRSCLKSNGRGIWSIDPSELKAAAHRTEKLDLCEGFVW